MPEYCSCGAQLPPDARFCHKCGKPQFDYPSPEPEETVAPVIEIPVKKTGEEISFRNRTAVRTGFTVAVAAFLLTLMPLPPPLQLLWFPLCPVVAGFGSAYLYQRRTGQRLGVENGARMGWITGIFEFILMLTFFCIVIISVSNQNGGLSGYLKQNSGQLPNIDQLTKALADPTTLIGSLVFALILFFFMFTLLPMVGGALGGKVFDRE